MNTLTALARDDSGATAIEYGLVAALVSVAALGTLADLGGSISTLFGVVAQVNNVATNLVSTQ